MKFLNLICLFSFQSEIQNIFRFYMKMYLKTIYRDLNYVDLANGYVNDLTSLVSNTSKLMQRRRKNLFMTFMYGFRNIKDYLLPQYDKNKIDLSHIAEMMAKLWKASLKTIFRVRYDDVSY